MKKKINVVIYIYIKIYIQIYIYIYTERYINIRIYKYAQQYFLFHSLIIVKLLVLLYSINMNIPSLIFLIEAWKEVRNTLMRKYILTWKTYVRIVISIFISNISIGCHYNHVNGYISTWFCLLRSAPASMSIRTQSA